jgi:hypothetical protein
MIGTFDYDVEFDLPTMAPGHLEPDPKHNIERGFCHLEMRVEPVAGDDRSKAGFIGLCAAGGADTQLVLDDRRHRCDAAESDPQSIELGRYSFRRPPSGCASKGRW